MKKGIISEACRNGSGQSYVSVSGQLEDVIAELGGKP